MKIKITILAIISLFAINSNGFSQGEVDTTLIVNGVCGMCEKTIETAALKQGATVAEWDVDTHVLTLTYNPKKTDLEAIGKAINKSGYDTELEVAPQESYDNLHGCCKYRDPKVVNDHKK